MKPTYEEFVEKVRDMRVLQREFFKRRNQTLVPQCKEAEREVDAMIERLEETPPAQLALEF